MVMEASPSPQSVGREFVRQYYTLLNKAPAHLHRFYNNFSSFVHGGLDAPNRETLPVVGQKQIHNRIQQLNFRDCHAKISQVDAQATLGNGVVVQVTGELSNGGAPMRRFTQTFVLAAQSPKKYYVHNDIFRYQDMVFSDEEGSASGRSDNEEEEVGAGYFPGGAPFPPPQPPSPAPLTSSAPLPPALNGHPPAAPPAQPAPPAHQPSHHHHLHQQQLGGVSSETSGEASGAPAAPSPPPAELVAPPPAPSPPPPEPQPLHQQTGSSVSSRRARSIVDSNVRLTSAGVSAAPPEPKTYANLLKSGSIGARGSPPAPGPAPAPLEQRARPRPAAAAPPEPREPRESRALVPPAATTARYSDAQQLFLGNLPHSATEDELRALFARFGPVAELRVHSKPPSAPGATRHPNYGFITYETAQAALECLAAAPLYFPCEGTEGGVKLNVEEKKARGREPPRRRPASGSRPAFPRPAYRR